MPIETFHIADANILIDFLDVKHPELLFNTDTTVKISQLTIGEIVGPHQKEMLMQYSNRFIEVRFSEDDIDLLTEHWHNVSGLSLSDYSSLFIAKEQDIILTGDRRMRTVAQSMDLTVHGALWLLDQALEKGLIQPPEAIDILLNLIHINPRLPVHECEKRLYYGKGKIVR